MPSHVQHLLQRQPELSQLLSTGSCATGDANGSLLQMSSKGGYQRCKAVKT